ncbi:unnamed protein product [Closterium sp. Naga37s-1]|nr:unnamed protein product [Closterium sp. Naga37s-1]
MASESGIPATPPPRQNPPVGASGSDTPPFNTNPSAGASAGGVSASPASAAGAAGEEQIMDLESYAANYSGHTRIVRLRFIAERCAAIGQTAMELEALRMAADELKRGENNAAYKEVIAKIAGRLGPKYELDQEWVDSVERRAVQKQEKLEMELNGYKVWRGHSAGMRLCCRDELDIGVYPYWCNPPSLHPSLPPSFSCPSFLPSPALPAPPLLPFRSPLSCPSVLPSPALPSSPLPAYPLQTNLIKESIRMGYNDLGDFFYSRGDLQQAFRCYVRTRDYCITSKHTIAMCLNVIVASVELGHFVNVSNYVQKAERGMTDPIVLAKLRSAAGLASLEGRKYKAAARKFVSASFDMGSSYSEVIAPQDVAVYGGLCALASFDRAELKSKLIDSVNFRNFLELVPEVRELIYDFYASRYASCLTYLDKLRPVLELDLHLHDHVAALYQQIRQRALIQYTTPFISVDLRTMAFAFNTNVAALEKELAALIMDNQVQARIDSHKGILYALVSSVSIVICNKALLSQFHFNFATTLSSWHLVITFLSLHVARTIGFFEHKAFDPKVVIGFGLLNGASIGLLNLTLGFNSVGFYQMAKLAIIPCTVCLQILFLKMRFSLQVQASLLVLLLGVGIATVTDLELNFVGTVLAALAIVSTCVAQIMTNTIQKGYKVSSTQLLYQSSPFQALILILSGPFVDAYLTGHNVFAFDYTFNVISFILLSCFIAVAVNFSSFLVIGKTSPVTYQVLGHLKTCLVLGMGYLLLNNPFSWRNAGGILVALVGMVLYSYVQIQEAKSRDAQISAPPSGGLSFEKANDSDRETVS